MKLPSNNKIQVSRTSQDKSSPVPHTVVMTKEAKKKLYNVLQETHPLYQENFTDWHKFLDAYRGGRSTIKYLVRHLREGVDNFNTRRKRLTYLNYCKPIIQMYMDYVFRQDINRECQIEKLSDEYDNFCINCDNNGKNLDEFMRMAAVYAKIFGFSWILIDMPTGPPPKNEQERKQKGIHPYLVNYIPFDVVNWETDDQGNLEWARVRQIVPKKKDIFITEKERGRSTNEKEIDTAGVNAPADGKIQIYRPQTSSFSMSEKGTDFIYTTWTKSGWIRHKVSKANDVEEVDFGVHNLGIVPMVLIYHEKSLLEEVIGESFLTDIAGMNLLILNWLSLLDEEIAQKTLNILTVATSPNAPSEVVIGSSNVLEYTGDKAPAFIAPASEPGEMIHRSVLSMRDEIYRQARLTGGMGVLKEMKSGLSLSYGFQETGQALADTADSIEHSEIKVMQVWAMWFKQDWKGVVSYPDDFGIEDLPADMEVVQKADTMINSSTFKAAIRQKIADRILPKMTEADRKKVTEEIIEGVDAAQELADELRKTQLEELKNPPEQNPSPTATGSPAIINQPKPIATPAPGKAVGKVVGKSGRVAQTTPVPGTPPVKKKINKTEQGLSNRGQGLKGSRKSHGRGKS